MMVRSPFFVTNHQTRHLGEALAELRISMSLGKALAELRISLNVSNKIGGGYDHLADSLIICLSGKKIPDFGEIAYLFEC